MRTLLKRLYRHYFPKPVPSLPPTAHVDWMSRRVRDRRKEYAAPPPQTDLFSILTAVSDPPLGAFEQLADSIFDQDYPHFEWVIVDNHCKHPVVRRMLALLEKQSCVTMVHANANRGILGGLRMALEKARRRYILPVDHDDRLYPDALRVLACALQDYGFPVLAYTDEDKLLPDGRPDHPFFKPDWDPLLFLNCCYTAHLGVMDRKEALSADIYTDSAAQGCPDYDAFSRLIAAGHTPVHIPEILYSWRMHEGSTAAKGADAKPYVVDCQYHVLQNHLEYYGKDEMLTIRANPLYGQPGMWRVARRPPYQSVPTFFALLGPTHEEKQVQVLRQHFAEYSGPPPVIQRLSGEATALRQAVAMIPPAALVAVVAPEVLPLTTDWPWEAVALFEAVPDAVMVGGCLLDQAGKIASAGEVLGMDGILGSPFKGKDFGTHEAYGMAICQRTVSAVSGHFFIARAEFLKQALTGRALSVQSPLLPALLGVQARIQGRRVLYTPHIQAQFQAAMLPRRVSADESWNYLQLYWPFLMDDPQYSPFLQLAEGKAYQPAMPAERAEILNRTLSQLSGPVQFHATLRVDPLKFLPREPVAKVSARRIRYDSAGAVTYQDGKFPSLRAMPDIGSLPILPMEGRKGTG
jgi:O-antigen biosynthesis protein